MSPTRIFTFNDTRLSYQIAGNGPEVLLLFHGFGQTGKVFEPFAKRSGNQYTLYFIDLYFHGQSFWPDETPLHKNVWQQILFQFLKEHNIDRFSALGFSIGAKFALTAAEAFSPRMTQLILIAPDGIQDNFWYTLATGTAVCRSIFRSMIVHPGRFERIAHTLKFLRLIHPGVIRFALRQMETEEKRKQVYHSWVVFRKLTIDVKHLSRQIQENNIRITILVGKQDRVIRPEKVKKLRQFLPQATMHLVDADHASVLKESLRWLTNN